MAFIWISVLAQFLVIIAKAQIQPTANVPCGDPNTLYAAYESSLLCLFFP